MSHNSSFTLTQSDSTNDFSSQPVTVSFQGFVVLLRNQKIYWIFFNIYFRSKRYDHTVSIGCTTFVHFLLVGQVLILQRWRCLFSGLPWMSSTLKPRMEVSKRFLCDPDVTLFYSNIDPSGKILDIRTSSVLVRVRT